MQKFDLLPPCAKGRPSRAVVRRVKSSGRLTAWVGEMASLACTLPLGCRRSEMLAGLLVEEVHEPRIGGDADLLAGLRVDALAEHAHHIGPAELGEDLRLRAGRLDHGHLGRQAVRVVENEVL